MGPRRLIAFTALALLAGVRAVSADASVSAMNPGIVAVRLADEAAGSVVAVKLSGAQHAPVLRVRDHLASVALADVDADGDLDILAASTRAGLLLWRNAGRGRFVLARLPKPRNALIRTPRASGRRATVSQDQLGEGDGDPALPRTEIARDPLILQSLFTSESFSPLTRDRVAPTGRGPPFTR